MPFEIHNWDEVSQEFQRGTVIIGNGASIAVDGCFRYGSLLENTIQQARCEDYFNGLSQRKKRFGQGSQTIPKQQEAFAPAYKVADGA